MNTGCNDKDLFAQTLCEARTITEIQSESIWPAGRYGPLVARIPVIISQTKVHINIESKVDLDHSVLAIRNCSRNVFLTQCKLLDIGDKKHGKVHLNGYISESIEYAASNCIKDTKLGADIRYKTVKVPFECATKIEYCSRPVLKTPNQFISVRLPETEKAVGDLFLSRERMFCELEEVSVAESDKIRVYTSLKNTGSDDHVPDTLIEYMIISVTFTLLQWQSVSISRPSPYNAQY
ncbi:MAG: hypothetical protein ACOYWZ_21125 [Bacillota bacterium]